MIKYFIPLGDKSRENILTRVCRCIHVRDALQTSYLRGQVQIEQFYGVYVIILMNLGLTNSELTKPKTVQKSIKIFFHYTVQKSIKIFFNNHTLQSNV